MVVCVCVFTSQLHVYFPADRTKGLKAECGTLGILYLMLCVIGISKPPNCICIQKSVIDAVFLCDWLV